MDTLAIALLVLLAGCDPGRTVTTITDGARHGDAGGQSATDASGTWYVETIAGDGEWGFADGPAHQARFRDPEVVALDSSGVLFVSDCVNHRIRSVADGLVRTVAGSGVPGLKDGPAATAQLGCAMGLAVDSTQVYFADTAEHVIRKVAGGVVTTVAGTGDTGYRDGPAASAQFTSPGGIAFGLGGELLIVDATNARIRVLQAGAVTTLAGSGESGSRDGAAASASFMTPWGIAVTSAGTVVVTDVSTHCVRGISGGQVFAIAGSLSPISGEWRGFADGPGSSAQFNFPSHVAVGPGNRIYVADQHNDRIRVIEDGNVSTIAGTGVIGYRDGLASQAQFSGPAGVAVGSSGEIYVADSGNNRIRRIYRK